MPDKKTSESPLANNIAKKPELTTPSWQRDPVPRLDSPEVRRRVGDVIAGHAHRRRKFPNDPGTG